MWPSEIWDHIHNTARGKNDFDILSAVRQFLIEKENEANGAKKPVR